MAVEKKERERDSAGANANAPAIHPQYIFVEPPSFEVTTNNDLFPSLPPPFLSFLLFFSDLSLIHTYIAFSKALESRLRGRGSETEEKITVRLNNAQSEIATSRTLPFHHRIVNDNMEQAYEEFAAIMNKHRMKCKACRENHLQETLRRHLRTAKSD